MGVSQRIAAALLLSVSFCAVHAELEDKDHRALNVGLFYLNTSYARKLFSNTSHPVDPEKYSPKEIRYNDQSAWSRTAISVLATGAAYYGMYTLCGHEAVKPYINSTFAPWYVASVMPWIYYGTEYGLSRLTHRHGIEAEKTTDADEITWKQNGYQSDKPNLGKTSPVIELPQDAYDNGKFLTDTAQKNEKAAYVEHAPLFWGSHSALMAGINKLRGQR